LGIVSAFRNRNPKWAAGLALFLSPSVATFYLGRGRLGLLYVLADLLVGNVFLFALKYYGIFQPALMFAAVIIAYRAGASVHVYMIASRQPPLGRYPWFARFHNVLLLLYIAPLVIALAIRNIVVQPFTIPSGSMLPTAQVGDYVFAEKLTYGMSQYSVFGGLGPGIRIGGRLPGRGEIVAFALPSNPRQDWISRVIGLPGDRIQMRGGRLFINGILVERERLEGSEENAPDVTYMERLPGGVEHQVVEVSDEAPGDNTREFLVPAEHYFMMGDNRDNSNDSRFEVGFVPADNIESRPFFIVFNPNSADRRWVPIR